jgi:hypothetical protein
MNAFYVTLHARSRVFFQTHKNKLIAIVLGFAGLKLVACSDFAGRVREYTYPPTFHYIADEQLRSTMWRLAYHSRELRELMKSPEEAAMHRAELMRELGMMERAVVDLNRSGWPTNYPLIDTNRSTFLRDIRMAREGISYDPPNFLLASSVSGACAYCHGNR